MRNEPSIPLVGCAIIYIKKEQNYDIVLQE